MVVGDLEPLSGKASIVSIEFYIFWERNKNERNFDLLIDLNRKSEISNQSSPWSQPLRIQFLTT